MRSHRPGAGDAQRPDPQQWTLLSEGVDVSVVVPWRGGDRWRTRSLEWCAARWTATYPDWEVVVGVTGDDGSPWVKARAVAAGVAQASGDLLVVADADVACDGTHLAVDAVTGGEPWAVPHRTVWRLTADQTVAVVEDGTPPERFGPLTLDQAPYVGVAGGGIVVLPRRTWARTPLDPRFEGWGGEDQAWGSALHTMAGPAWRGGWRLFHLWHPPQDRLSRQTGTRANEQLRRRYRAARGHPHRMGRLVADACHHIEL